ncbi:MAG: hypothetical protein DME98_03285 [Verrucomicrobia bacterium]|nr:MAG: hypothetical protein DME98_03285 [Verrucomicrobiota bacterium]PYJ31512.1 MAG: hypothetical protein DME88_14565 [Verrucomicrobiota bacterium]
MRRLRKTLPIHGEQALAIFHNRYRPSLVRSFKIKDTLPEDYCHVHGDRDFFYSSYPNCYFVQFALTYDDPSIVNGRLLVISKSTAQILYDE